MPLLVLNAFLAVRSAAHQQGAMGRHSACLPDFGVNTQTSSTDDASCGSAFRSAVVLLLAPEQGVTVWLAAATSVLHRPRATLPGGLKNDGLHRSARAPIEEQVAKCA